MYFFFESKLLVRPPRLTLIAYLLPRQLIVIHLATAAVRILSRSVVWLYLLIAYNAGRQQNNWFYYLFFCGPRLKYTSACGVAELKITHNLPANHLRSLSLPRSPKQTHLHRIPSVTLSSRTARVTISRILIHHILDNMTCLPVST